jgi:hypothetical protein
MSISGLRGCAEGPHAYPLATPEGKKLYRLGKRSIFGIIMEKMIVLNRPETRPKSC